MPSWREQVQAVVTKTCRTKGSFGHFTSICRHQRKGRCQAASDHRTRPIAVARGALGDAVRLPLSCLPHGLRMQQCSNRILLWRVRL
jgi:hypothetical protein